MSEKKIHVMLYGGKPLFGGKEKPLVADEIFCSAYDHCQLYEEGKCVCCRAAFERTDCPYGHVKQTKGYTSRAKKYYDFKNKYAEDAAYGALDRPRDVYLRIVGDYAYIDLAHVTLEYHEDTTGVSRPTGTFFIGPNSRVLFGNPGFFTKSAWIPKDEITSEDIAYIAKFKPCAMMDRSEISDFQEKTVPAFIEDVKRHWPEIYAELERDWPEVCGREVDYRGRRAYLATLKKGIEIKTGDGTYTFDGKSLVCEDYNNILVSVHGVKAKHARLEIPVDENSVIEVKDNSWVVPGVTRFA